MTETESESKKEEVLVVDKEKEDYSIAGVSEERAWMEGGRGV